MVTFRTKISSMVKKLQICNSLVSNLRKHCLCYLLFYNWWKPCLLFSKRVFRCFLLNYTDFAHEISHTKPSKYDSTFGTKISICLKKVGGWGCGSEQAPLMAPKPKYRLKGFFSVWMYAKHFKEMVWGKNRTKHEHIEKDCAVYTHIVMGWDNRLLKLQCLVLIH